MLLLDATYITEIISYDSLESFLALCSLKSCVFWQEYKDPSALRVTLTDDVRYKRD